MMIFQPIRYNNRLYNCHRKSYFLWYITSDHILRHRLHNASARTFMKVSTYHFTARIKFWFSRIAREGWNIVSNRMYLCSRLAGRAGREIFRGKLENIFKMEIKFSRLARFKLYLHCNYRLHFRLSVVLDLARNPELFYSETEYF